MFSELGYWLGSHPVFALIPVLLATAALLLLMRWIEANRKQDAAVKRWNAARSSRQRPPAP